MERLPKGLVSISKKIPTELDGIGVDAVDTGDIVQLWKAYSTNPSAHEGDVGHRLQNFFWRIWSSKRLSSALTGSSLSRLFLQISEPDPALTLTPTLPPTPFRPPAKAQAQPKSKESDPATSSLKRAGDEKHPHPPNHTKSQSHPAPTTATKPLQPILKKSNSSSHGEVQKTTRLLLTGLGGQSVTRKPSNPPTPVPPSRPILFAEQTQQGPSTAAATASATTTASRAGQKKTKVIAVASKAKAKSSKRRPVLMRRKSSQQSSNSATSTRNHSPTGFVDAPIDSDEGFDVTAEIDEEAVEDSPDELTIVTPNAPIEPEQITVSPTTPDIPRASTPRLKLKPKKLKQMTAKIATTDNLSPKATSRSPPPESFPPLAQEDDNEEIPEPALPEAFVSDLKELLHKNTPLPPLRPHASPPTVGFFSAIACRHYDVRHLSEGNYEQPNSSKLVAPDFRTRFVEQKRIADEYYAQYVQQCLNQDDEEREGDEGPEHTNTTTQSAFFEQNAMNTEGQERPGTGSTTEATTSPSKSRFGDSHTQSHGASTIATSVLTGGSGDTDPALYQGGMFAPANVVEPAPIHGHDDSDEELGPDLGHQHGFVNSTLNASINATTPAMAMPMPVPGGTGNPFATSTGLSLNRGMGGLSLLIEQSRNSLINPGMGNLGTTATTTEKDRSEQ
ncbi:hypothetical protein BDW74DRAFT_154028 [Aspergillus multicolor]|uniref:GATA-like domain-containing protein n=1 Tax=Aspergillus multicolor TaxID=41759 RepID=UPI003CCD4836